MCAYKYIHIYTYAHIKKKSFSEHSPANVSKISPICLTF